MENTCGHIVPVIARTAAPRPLAKVHVAAKLVGTIGKYANVTSENGKVEINFTEKSPSL